MILRLCLLWIMAAAAPAFADPVAFSVDPDKSDIGFNYYYSSAPQGGSFPEFEAEVAIDFDQVSNSSVSIRLEAGRARADFPLATLPLRGETMLDADRFPTINFVSNSIKLGPHPTVLIGGDLTIRDTTLPLTVTVTLLAQDANAMVQRDRIVVRLNGQLSRSAFGVSGYADLVEDRLDILGDIALTRVP